ncbi:hypothetical protein PUNSTDRAFT_115970 [Punctularia strigosozonata HHB-11173 SS5]|uniref:uncharacterized protein n=1 Tax=Punctularia strigosozonata (strain HHB-11173) TaxID=741275 RepID=UPI0004416D05|nr:uncharacterized protein PUNSTDRAFT_115970 [Punctularia strigosozonata HHB-11173 SS5]EIN05573.1 hypothetical protein PUNSTDRAFT_115970 [Punctularia strigosozonata HHB-11173 SS5]
MRSPSLWLALLGACCTTASAAPGKQLHRRAFFLEWFTQADTPTSTTAGDKFQNGDTLDGKWFDLPADVAGIELEGDTTSLAWRLKGDNDSAVELSVNTATPPFVLQADNFDTSIDVSANIHTTYNASAASPNAGETAVIPITSRSISVENSECDSSVNITATVAFANGTSVTTDAVDNWGTGISDDVAGIQLVVNNTDFNNLIQFTFNVSSPYTAQFGNGSNVPTVSVSYGIDVQFCPD